MTYKNSVSFIDAENKKATIEVEITERNGYPQFTACGTYQGTCGQCLDQIKPATDKQKELIELWNKYHLKDVSAIHNFTEHVKGIIDVIKYEEQERKENAEQLEGDAATLEKMEQQGISEDMLEAVNAYIALGTGDDDLDDFDESYSGEFASDEEFAEDMAENIGAIDRNAAWPNNHIDWTRAANDLMQDYCEEGGHYFRNV